MKKVIDARNGRKQSRTDGWSNLVTLLGTSADKRMASEIHWDNRSPEFYEQLYAGGGIPARVVDLVPERALQNGWTWLNADNKRKKMLNDACQSIDLRGNVIKAWKWGRAFGGGLLHIVTDTRDPASPLQKGEKVLALRDLSRWDVRIMTTDIEYDMGNVNYGHPRIYYLNVQMGSQYKGYPIHWTRVIRFDGQLVPRRTFIRNNYWHDSVLNRPYNSIRNYEMANDATAACLLDFNVDVFKMKNLANYIGAGKEALVKSRIETMQYAKSVLNSMMIDADEEDYENKGRSMQGVPELLDKQANRVVADTDFPHTVLFGESPEGSNATGNSTNRQFDNYIVSEQENTLRPRLNRLFELIFPDDEEVDFKFNPLRVLDDKEEADYRKTVAETDEIYVNLGAVDASEVASSRWGGDEYSSEMEIDWEARESGEIVPGQQQLGEDEHGHGESEPDEGDNGSGHEPPPSEPEPEQEPAKEGKESKDKPAAKKDAEGVSLNKLGTGDVYEGEAMSVSAFEPRNQILQVENAVPKTSTFIGQTMSEPMRDPRTDPQMKGPGIPNRNRTVNPTRGNGIMAPSGASEEDAGSDGQSREGVEGVEGGERNDRGVAATMKEFAKGTLKSSSGQKVTSAKQAAAIGYAEEKGDDGFKESDHPRAKNGEFGSGGGGSSNAEQAPKSATPNSKDVDAALDQFMSSVSDDQWEAFQDDFDKGLAEAKTEKATKENADKFYRAHTETMETNTQVHSKNNSRGKDTKDPSIGIKVDGKIYMLDGQHRLNTAIKSGGSQDVVVIDGKFLSKYKGAEKTILGRKHNGTKTDSQDSERKRAACVIVKDGDKFLMGKTNKEGRYTLPGGHVEPHESMHQGGVRELFEETGLKAKKLKFLGSRLVESEMGKPVEVAMYEHNLQDDAKPTPKNDPDKEVAKWEWFSHKEPLPEDVLGNLKHANNIALDHMGLLK